MLLESQGLIASARMARKRPQDWNERRRPGSGSIRFWGARSHLPARWLVAWIFFLGTLSPFLSAREMRNWTAEAAAKAELVVLLGETDDSYSASFCRGAGTDSAEPGSGKRHHRQNCPLCQALHDFQNSLPPCLGAILLTHDAGKSPCVNAARCALRPRIERVGQPRAPPSLHEVDVV
jgi:hypothetical protein